MKKFLVVALSLSLAFTGLVLASCGKKDPGDDSTSQSQQIDKVAVTFRQANQPDIVKTLDKGSDLSDIPTPVAREGYTVVWETVDFNDISESIIVNAVETANTYTIIYNVGEGATVSPATQEVVYDSVPTFAVPERAGYNFTGWYYEGKTIDLGPWKIAKDNVELVAGWSKIAEKFTVTFRQQGQEDKVFEEVLEDTEFTQIPDVVAKKGYNVEWKAEDLAKLTSVKENVVVQAVETAKTYTITLKSTTVSTATSNKTVTYDADYELPTLTDTTAQYNFKGWAYNGSLISMKGTWNIDAENIELVAVWEEVEEEECWTGNY